MPTDFALSLSSLAQKAATKGETKPPSNLKPTFNRLLQKGVYSVPLPSIPTGNRRINPLNITASPPCLDGETYKQGNVDFNLNGGLHPSSILQMGCNLAFGLPNCQFETTDGLGWDHFQFKEVQTMHTDLGGTHFAFNSYSRHQFINDEHIWDYPRIINSGAPENCFPKVPEEFGASQFIQFPDGAMGWYNTGPGPETSQPVNCGLYLDRGQQIGIGTDAPNARLQVAGDVRVGELTTVQATSISEAEGALLYLNGGRPYTTDAENSDPIFLQRFNQAADRTSLRVNLGDDGGVLIDKTEFGYYKYDGSGWHQAVGIYASGEVFCKKVKVTINAFDDYVFAQGYKLLSLKETEDFIKMNGHLPDVPCAEEVIENGLDLTEMNRALLRKIEEMTLHLIRLEKEVEVLKTSK